VFAAPDVRSVSGEIPGGGTATLVFSEDEDAGVLVMNNVPPPQQGTVYQMWLLGEGDPKSAGTMDAKAVAPSTTAVLPDLGNSTALTFTVEPGGGSEQPTGAIFAELPLT
jgi:anti-sigma-K factor RskA